MRRRGLCDLEIPWASFMTWPIDAGADAMNVDNRRLGVAVAAVGLFLLLTLRIWASPIVMTVTGRGSVALVSFLAIPLFLLVIAAGIAIFLWGEEFGFGRS